MHSLQTHNKYHGPTALIKGADEVVWDDCPWCSGPARWHVSDRGLNTGERCQDKTCDRRHVPEPVEPYVPYEVRKLEAAVPMSPQVAKEKQELTDAMLKGEHGPELVNFGVQMQPPPADWDCSGDGGCQYPEPHKHGFACDWSCGCKPKRQPAASSQETAPQHYRGSGTLQPWDVIAEFGLDFWAGNVIKYVCRAGKKGSRLEDLKKARHYLDYLIEKEGDA